MIKRLQALTAQRKAAAESLQKIAAEAAKNADGCMTEAQAAEFDQLEAKLKQLDAEIARQQTAINAAKSTGTSVDIGNPNHIGVTSNLMADPKRGFASFGEFAHAVRQASSNPSAADERLRIDAAAASSYGNESTGADGGYLVPPEFSNRIITTGTDGIDALINRTDYTPVTGNSMTFPVDETTPWGSSGIRAYWGKEASAATQTKPDLSTTTLRLDKLTALVPITEELLSDTSSLSVYLAQKTPAAVKWKTNDALCNGTGIGMPVGFFNAACAVSVAKETGQTAATVNVTNITKMRARMLPASFTRSIWMINNDVLPQLDTLAYGTSSTNTPIYNPVGGEFGFGTLLGRPVMVTQHNETVGTVNDIVLCDWLSYLTIGKAAGIETAQSMHFWFDQGLTAFRATFRCAGQPAMTAAVTPAKGSNSLSSIVKLATRA